MADYGSLIVPLAVVGMYLNYCGNHLLHYVATVMRRRIFYPSHRVTSIVLLQNGEILTQAVKKQVYVKKGEDGNSIIYGEKESTVSFRSKGIVVSNGGHQALPPAFYKDWFPFMKDRQDRVLLPDQFLKRKVYKETMSLINTNKFKNIVIIGASHSGFSSAWLLLYGPATFKRENALLRTGQPIRTTHFPDAEQKSNPHCCECCDCSEAKKAKNPKCDCLCKCWGYFQPYEDWGYDEATDMPNHLGEGSIKILYRDKIRVFYGTVTHAKQDGYNDFSEHIFSNKNGFVYSYTGLRGDAKALYRKVKRGDEKRVAFVKAETPEAQAAHVREADLVIWACGYQTNKIPIKDHEGKEVVLSQRVAHTQVDVDGKCRMCVADGSLLTKSFGTGLAYPTRTNDGMIRPDAGKPEPRADSFSLYCGWVANRILLNILPKNILDNKLHRTMRNNRKKAIENNANNHNNKVTSPTKKGGKADNGGNSGGQQAQNNNHKTNKINVKNVESVVKKQIKQMVAEEKVKQDEAANKKAAAKPNVSPSGKAGELQHSKSDSKLAQGTSSGNIGGQAAARHVESKEASKKGVAGGYLRGTLASDTRAKLIQANESVQSNIEGQQQVHESPIKEISPALTQNAVAQFMPAQITQSQLQYIQRRQDVLEKLQAEEKQLHEKH